MTLCGREGVECGILISAVPDSLSISGQKLSSNALASLAHLVTNSTLLGSLLPNTQARDVHCTTYSQIQYLRFHGLCCQYHVYNSSAPDLQHGSFVFKISPVSSRPFEK